MFFASDNGGPVHPQIMQRIVEANADFAMPYGADALMGEVRERLRDVFEAPDAAVYLVATGTAANALALGLYCQPWQTMFCAQTAHIQEDECNAPEFFAGGAKLTAVPTEDRMTPEALRTAIAPHAPDNVHSPQRGPVSITQLTERGTAHSLAELRALTDVARAHGLPVHLDGARFANAQAALGCSAAEMSWKSGVDVVSFGGTKNGCMGVEAVVLFDPDRAWEFELRRKRAGHLFSKHRFLSAQMAAYLTNDLWLTLASRANENAAYLVQGLRAKGAEFLHEPQANMVFAAFPRATHQRLQQAGAQYYVWNGTLEGPETEMVGARLVCDWSITRGAIDTFLGHF